MAEKLCCIIDAQGFVKNGVFFPREIAFCSDIKNVSFLVDTKLKYYKMSEKDRKTNKFIERKFLGIPLTQEFSAKCIIDYKPEIYRLYLTLKTSDKKLVGIKNYQLSSILSVLNIPFINLEDFGCSRLDILEKIYRENCCGFHNKKNKRGQWKCAVRKANILWKWVKNRKTDL